MFTAGVKKGDRVAIYMPMITEIVVAMLACARIGAVHSIVVSKNGHFQFSFHRKVLYELYPCDKILRMDMFRQIF